VGSLHPAIEIIDSRYADWLKVSLPSIVADMGSNGALVVGPAVKRWRTLDLAKPAVRMTVDGKVVGEGTGAAVMGDPADALVWLANLARRRGGLAAGDMVTTGTCTGLQRAPAGASTVVGDFGKLGSVTIKFVA
jgi:2-keto-4-pentenoate hydratase